MKIFVLLVACVCFEFGESQETDIFIENGRGPETIIIEEGRRPEAQPRRPVIRPATSPEIRPRAPGTEVHRENGPPNPYNFEFKNEDNDGNQQFHSETGDENGAKRGTYGYSSSNGVYRIVDYIADRNGYKATVRTNEPGVGKHENGDPSDTSFVIEPPPPGVVPPASEGERIPRRAQPDTLRRSISPAARVPSGLERERGEERIIIEERGGNSGVVEEPETIIVETSEDDGFGPSVVPIGGGTRDLNTL
ncbi:cuticle protein-like protein [Dinothrombium tinctorium]|uniref:Cuticle protein-like protein n=1 Tax=Dinothrombium tinctorium TaxID=1965070 RepID=A0A3S3R2R9_9ACAR|nr:cuticle protein-like protein [Dinothrombium tinctorium]RWS17579.1 cuticle protein-like protein [Dinothrombium tinctorium]RWS17653.1 cuticle protein-like protein [Dinothrombium tinctorium]